jgi:signal transduction histidine kinase
VGAIREHAGNLSGGPMLFEVVATEECSVIPAAVEVALWRIATEAMTNVVRHAGACHCVVMLTLIGRAAELEILDDGCGIDGARSGVGLSSARERAAELGGRFTVGSGPEGGTRVWASLPLGPA